MPEIKRYLEYENSYDVVVCGGGPAGMCAAMAAARQGADVALIERAGSIGGNIVTGHVGPFLGKTSEGTMADEVRKLLGVKGEEASPDVEEAKIELIKWIDRPDIHVFLNTPVTDVIMDNDAVEGIVIGTQSGIKAIKGKVFIDATGDGAVAYMAGAPFEMGRGGDGLVQPATIMFTLSGINPEQSIECRHEEHDTMLEKGNYLELCKEACRRGELPQSVNIVRLYPTKHADERMVNATQLNKINGLLPEDIFKAQAGLRRQIPQVIDFLKENVPGFENCRLRDSSDIVGIRETRRVLGEYILCDSDLTSGRRFEDVVVHDADFCIDIHNPDGAGQAESEGCPEQVVPYDIPYRCFVPKKVERLFTAGRCISGTHRAHASYRVMNICMAMGEAVGIAAALCAATGQSPRMLDYKIVQSRLEEKGIILK